MDVFHGNSAEFHQAKGSSGCLKTSEDGTVSESSKTQNREDQEGNGLFNGLDREELLETRHGREVIDFSRIDGSVDKYTSLKELIEDANTVAVYGSEDVENAYFEHVFRRGLGMDLYRGMEQDIDHCYEDLVDHIAAVNSELDEEALEEARIAYRLNFRGEELYGV